MNLSKYIYKCMFFILMIGIGNNGVSQSSIRWEINPGGDNQINEKVPDGKALLIFDSPVDLTFESSIENIDQPHKKDGKYFLFVNKGSQVITLKYFGNYNVNFGQLMDPNTLPPLKNKEILFFNIEKTQGLIYYDVTEKDNSNLDYLIEQNNNNEALIIINTDPSDLVLQISDHNNGITKVKYDKGSYNIYIKSSNKYVLQLKNNNFDTLNIQIPNLKPGDIRIYMVINPNNIDEVNQDAEIVVNFICNAAELLYETKFFNSKIAEEQQVEVEAIDYNLLTKVQKIDMERIEAFGTSVNEKAAVVTEIINNYKKSTSKQFFDNTIYGLKKPCLTLLFEKYGYKLDQKLFEF